jgi:hypothetical protein
MSFLLFGHIGCSGPPTQVSMVTRITRNGSDVSLDQSRYPFGSVVTHECQCGEQWPEYRLRVINRTSCYGEFGWEPQTLSGCVSGMGRYCNPFPLCI